VRQPLCIRGFYETNGRSLVASEPISFLNFSSNFTVDDRANIKWLPTATMALRLPVSMSKTRKQAELLTWFQKQAPSLAPAYEGAVRLISDKTFPGRIHFIAHAVRDIMDRLPFALEPELSQGRVQYEYRLDNISKTWPFNENTFGTNSVSPFSENVSIATATAMQINDLIIEHRVRRQRPDQYELLFQHLTKADPAAKTSRRIVDEFRKMRRWFMDQAHLRREIATIVDDSELHRRFAVFQDILHGFVGNFFTVVSELDAALEQANQ
jgi:hypothetical protein